MYGRSVCVGSPCVCRVVLCVYVCPQWIRWLLKSLLCVLPNESVMVQLLKKAGFFNLFIFYLYVLCVKYFFFFFFWLHGWTTLMSSRTQGDGKRHGRLSFTSYRKLPHLFINCWFLIIILMTHIQTYIFYPGNAYSWTLFPSNQNNVIQNIALDGDPKLSFEKIFISERKFPHDCIGNWQLLITAKLKRPGNGKYNFYFSF